MNRNCFIYTEGEYRTTVEKSSYKNYKNLQCTAGFYGIILIPGVAVFKQDKLDAILLAVSLDIILGYRY